MSNPVFEATRKDMETALYSPQAEYEENSMIMTWRKFTKIVELWINKHGKDAGYDKRQRNGSIQNNADNYGNPIGWLQESNKYSQEAYDIIDRGDWNYTELMELCMKSAHCAQLAYDRILARFVNDPSCPQEAPK